MTEIDLMTPMERKRKERNEAIIAEFKELAPKLLQHRNDVLDYSDDRGESGKEHQEEEYRADNLAGRHDGEDLGQRDKNEIRAACGRNVIAEADREDDKPCGERDKGVEAGNEKRLINERAILRNIAAENAEGAGNA